MNLDKDIRFSEKKVDDSWKNEVSCGPGEAVPDREKDSSAAARPELSMFMTLVSSLGMQALIQLGEIEDPNTHEVRADLTGAKMSIDLLLMLKEKTKGNLDDEESKVLESLLYDLQMKFVDKRNSSG